MNQTRKGNTNMKAETRDKPQLIRFRLLRRRRCENAKKLSKPNITKLQNSDTFLLQLSFCVARCLKLHWEFL